MIELKTGTFGIQKQTGSEKRYSLDLVIFKKNQPVTSRG